MATIRKLGSIYYKGAVANPGFTCYTQDPQISFGDTVPGRELRWVVAGNYLVGDRCACTNISWNNLARLGFIAGWPVRIDNATYKCRCPQVGTDLNDSSEWNKVLDELGVEDSLWHWKGYRFWGQEARKTQKKFRMIRGYYSARSLGYTNANDRTPSIGFRPVLEPLPPIPDDLGPLIGKKVCVYGSGRTGFTAKLKAADEYDLIRPVQSSRSPGRRSQ